MRISSSTHVSTRAAATGYPDRVEPVDPVEPVRPYHPELDPYGWNRPDSVEGSARQNPAAEAAVKNDPRADWLVLGFFAAMGILIVANCAGLI